MRLSRWMLGGDSVAAVLCALALLVVLVFPAPGVACTGDCNGDGDVTVDEILQAVALALADLAPDTCDAADADGDGHVTIDELVSAVHRALTGCPASPTPSTTSTPATETATPEATATETTLASPTSTFDDSLTATPTGIGVEPTVTPTASSTDTAAPTATVTGTLGVPTNTPSPSGTSTHTRTPTPSGTQAASATPSRTPSNTQTSTPTPTNNSLGTRRFSLALSSLFLTVFGNNQVDGRAGFTGYLDLRAGVPDPVTGVARIDVTDASDFISLDLNPGAICIRPLVDDPILNAGLVDCDGGMALGTDTLQDHNIGAVGVGGFTAGDCTAAGGVVEAAGLPHVGVCNGAVSVGPLVGVDAGAGAVAIGPDALLGLQGLPVELAFEVALPCGDEAPNLVGALGLISGPSRARIFDRDNQSGATLLYENPGENFSCASWTQENGPGKLVLTIPNLHGAGVLDVINVFVLDD